MGLYNDWKYTGWSAVAFLLFVVVFVYLGRLAAKCLSNIAYYRLLQERRLELLKEIAKNASYPSDSLKTLLPPGTWSGLSGEKNRRLSTTTYDLKFEEQGKLRGTCDELNDKYMVAGAFNLSRGDAAWGVVYPWGGLEFIGGLKNDELVGRPVGHTQSGHSCFLPPAELDDDMFPATIAGHYATAFGAEGLLELRHSTTSEYLGESPFESRFSLRLAQQQPLDHLSSPGCIRRAFVSCIGPMVFRMSPASLLRVSNWRKTKRPLIKLTPMRLKTLRLSDISQGDFARQESPDSQPESQAADSDLSSDEGPIPSSSGFDLLRNSSSPTKDSPKGLQVPTAVSPASARTSSGKGKARGKGKPTARELGSSKASQLTNGESSASGDSAKKRLPRPAGKVAKSAGPSPASRASGEIAPSRSSNKSWPARDREVDAPRPPPSGNSYVATVGED